MIKRDTILSIILLLFCAIVFITSQQMPPGPKFFPEILSLILAVLSLILLFSSLKGKSIVKNNNNKENTINWKKFITIVAATFLYIFFIETIGYIISTFGLIILISWVLGYKNKVSLVIISLIVTMVLYSFFALVFNIPLPKGLLSI